MGLFAGRRGYIWPAVGVLIGILIVYIVGIPYLYLSVNYILKKEMSFASAFRIGFLVPIFGDILKGGLALVIFYSTRKVLTLPLSGR
jgi:biotin transporter BioY